MFKLVKESWACEPPKEAPSAITNHNFTSIWAGADYLPQVWENTSKSVTADGFQANQAGEEGDATRLAGRTRISLKTQLKMSTTLQTRAETGESDMSPLISGTLLCVRVSVCTLI